MLELGRERSRRNARKKTRHTLEQIIGKLREAEVVLAKGGPVGLVCQPIGVIEQAYYRWRKEYGGLKVEQARGLKKLEKENSQRRKAVADLTLDKPILAEAAKGNFQALSGGSDSWIRR